MTASAPAPQAHDGHATWTQFLGADGQLRASLPTSVRAPETLRALYRRMIEIRSVDKEAMALLRNGQLARYAACRGEEAILAAITLNLRANDHLLIGESSRVQPDPQDLHLLDVLRCWSDARTAGPAAVATALAAARTLVSNPAAQSSPAIVLAVCGNERSDSALLRAALPVAAQTGLPLVIVVPRRLWQLTADSDDRPLMPCALADDNSGTLVDGNDVIAMHDTLYRALAEARAGRGPLLIEAITCPLAERATPHDLRPQDELRTAWERCPIKRLRRYLESQQLWNIGDEEALLLSAGAQATHATHDWAAATAAKPPAPML